MSVFTPFTTLVGRVLDRWLRRSDYRAVWDWRARSAHNARLAVARFADPAEFNQSGQETASHLVQALHIGPGETVLEIGCGTGRVGKALARSCHRWIGCDVSQRMLDHARAALGGLGNVSLVALDGYTLAPVPSTSVDVVSCTGVFMHLDEWDRFGYVEEAWRVLRPGGRIYVDNINLLGEDGWARFMELKRLAPRARPPKSAARPPRPSSTPTCVGPVSATSRPPRARSGCRRREPKRPAASDRRPAAPRERRPDMAAGRVPANSGAPA